MPRLPNDPTGEKTAKRDRCVANLKAKGTEESRAYAICTASVEGTTNHKGKKK